MQLSDKVSNPKPQRKKPLNPKAPLFQSQGNNVKGVEQVPRPLPLKTVKKATKRSLQKEAPLPFQKPEVSTSDSLPESSTSGNEYRTLRRKYLLLEEESFTLGSELREVEGEVKTLEDEKLALLDQLVVLEGLIDPLELLASGCNYPKPLSLEQLRG